MQLTSSSSSGCGVVVVEGRPINMLFFVDETFGFLSVVVLQLYRNIIIELIMRYEFIKTEWKENKTIISYGSVVVVDFGFSHKTLRV